MAATEVPPGPQSQSEVPIFLCSEENEDCYHVCRRHRDHKVHWSDETFLEDDIPEPKCMDEDLRKSLEAIIYKFTVIAANVSPEALDTVEEDMDEAIRVMIAERVREDYGLESSDESENEDSSVAMSDTDLEDDETTTGHDRHRRVRSLADIERLPPHLRRRFIRDDIEDDELSEGDDYQ